MLKMEKKKENEFVIELCNLINRYSVENISNTPDWVLADYLNNCLKVFNVATRNRDNFYGGRQSILEDERKLKWDVPVI